MFLFGKNSIHIFKFLIPKRLKQTIFRSTQHEFKWTKFSSLSSNNNQHHLVSKLLEDNINFYRWFTKTRAFRLVLTFTIKERIYDNLILFTRLFHMQSNVYLTLQIRRISQLCLLFRRIYPPSEFHVFFENIFNSWKFLKILTKEYRNQTKYRLDGWLLSFAAYCAFSWDDSNRISDDEFDELIQDFSRNYEKYSFKNDPQQQRNCNNLSNGSLKSPNCNSQDNELLGNDSSFMVVNCMQADNTSVVMEWEEIINRPNFHVWRKSVNNTALYQYKVFGSFDDISAYSFYSVQKDLDYRKEWDKLVIKLDVIDVEAKTSQNSNPNIYDSGNELIHWIMKYPYPMMNREYLYIRRFRIDYDKKFIVLISRSVSSSNIPESQEHVRVFDYMSHMVIKPHENFHKPGFEFMLTYFDNPRASFPSPAYAWMAARGVPDFVEKLHQAALKFSSWENSILSTETMDENWSDHEDLFYMSSYHKLKTSNEDEIYGLNPNTSTTDNVDSKKEKVESKNFLSRLPEPTIDFDSLIWN